MSVQTSAIRPTGHPERNIILATHRGVIERLGDPYLTDHDRWVLGQFARFLSGETPEPDPRVRQTHPTRPLYRRVRSATL